MFELSGQRISELFTAFEKQKIIVIGDLMLDSYFWGTVSRISPEAPVPVVELSEETYQFGGAANVANNIMSLGAEVIPVGIVGADPNGKKLKKTFSEQGFATEGIVTLADRPTTTKTRVIADGQHVVRTDKEVTDYISAVDQKKIIRIVEHHFSGATAVVLEDYNKGLLTPELIKATISMAHKKGIKILVDPKFLNFFSYAGVTLFKPNRKEAGERLGMPIKSREEIKRCGRELRKRLDCRGVLLTLGEQGMALFEGDGNYSSIPTQAREVHDVSGAGDTVIATMAVVLSAQGTMKEAAAIANTAAGIVCGEVGVVPIQKQQLYKGLSATGLEPV